MSARLVAQNIGLSESQLKRAEAGLAVVRFFSGWNFCDFIKVNPLWLAFGEPENPTGFSSSVNSYIHPEATFLDVMVVAGGDYRAYWDHDQSAIHEAADALRRAGGVSPHDLRSAAMSIVPVDRHASYKEILAAPTRKRYLRIVPAERIVNWNELLLQLQTATAEPGTKTRLAATLGVTTQAVSQWLSGASAPKADTALRLRAWVLRAGDENQSGARVEARTPRKTRVSKSTK